MIWMGLAYAYILTVVACVLIYEYTRHKILSNEWDVYILEKEDLPYQLKTTFQFLILRRMDHWKACCYPIINGFLIYHVISVYLSVKIMAPGRGRPKKVEEN